MQSTRAPSPVPCRRGGAGDGNAGVASRPSAAGRGCPSGPCALLEQRVAPREAPAPSRTVSCSRLDSASARATRAPLRCVPDSSAGGRRWRGRRAPHAAAVLATAYRRNAVARRRDRDSRTTPGRRDSGIPGRCTAVVHPGPRSRREGATGTSVTSSRATSPSRCAIGTTARCPGARPESPSALAYRMLDVGAR
jgi:hypothetical protein